MSAAAGTPVPHTALRGSPWPVFWVASVAVFLVSLDTTMGFTPLEGLVMGSRSGDVDPGVIPYVAERLGIDGADRRDP